LVSLTGRFSAPLRPIWNSPTSTERQRHQTL
jgi:hypothetical protein